MCQKKHGDEKRSNDPGARLYLFDISAAYAYYNVGDKTEGDSVRDVVCKGHQGQGKKSGNRDLEIVPFDVLDRHHHEDSHVDQRRSSSTAGYQLGNRA